jgi:transposase-like protein
MGRPSKFSEELANQICENIAHSDKGLVSICKELGLNASTVYDWINNNLEFANKYARAREIQADYLADQIIEIADETHSDTSVNEQGYEVTNHEVIARSRLRVDARKWKASKLYPKKYADRIDSDFTTKGESLNLPPFMRANESKP